MFKDMSIIESTYKIVNGYFSKDDRFYRLINLHLIISKDDSESPQKIDLLSFLNTTVKSRVLIWPFSVKKTIKFVVLKDTM